MSRLNRIQNEIKQLEGGRFQKLCDMFLYRKNEWGNIQSLGSMDGTDKTTIGIPDTYYFDINTKKYTLVMYGTRKDATKKLESDIEDAITKSKVDTKEIQEIICCHTSSNISIEMDKKLRNLAHPILLTIIGIDTLAQDLLKFGYQDIVKDVLGIEKSTDQVWKLNEFISRHDKSKTNAKISIPYISEENELEELMRDLNENQILLVKGEPGVGKTRLAVEICNKFGEKYNVVTVKSNNLSAYQDIKDSLESNQTNYLLLDDANTLNSLQAVIDLLLLPEFENNLKIIITVRSYAINSIINLVKNFSVKIFEKKLMGDKSIDRLIKTLYPEIPSNILSRVKKLSRSNPRLAVLAIDLIKRKGYTSFNNGKEILLNYYSGVLNDNNITNMEKKTLFILSLFKKLNLEAHEELANILSYFGMNYDEFHESLNELYNKELCDIYQNKATKVSDQSLADYVLIDFISSSKRITLYSLFSNFYPRYYSELINLINAINQFESNKEWYEYLEIEINKIYLEIIKESQREDFLKRFTQLLQIEALEFVYHKIESTEYNHDVITNKEFTRSIKNANITDSTIIILCRLANSDKTKDATQWEKGSVPHYVKALK